MRHDYRRLDTRGERPYACLIIDEKDNMLIDENKKITMLTQQISLLEQLGIVYQMIWSELTDSVKKLRKDSEGKYFYYRLETGEDVKQSEAELNGYLIERLENKILEHLTDENNATVVLPKTAD